MVLGLGCDTMATLTTRILETRRERLIAILLLALGVPCSAQLTVVVVLTSGLSPLAFAVWAFVVGGVMLVVGRLAAILLPGRSSDFVLELPPLRLPRPGNILIKTAGPDRVVPEGGRPPVRRSARSSSSSPTACGCWAPWSSWPSRSWPARWGCPGRRPRAFVVGFLRRDFGAAGLYRLAEQGRLDPVQIVVALVTLTLFMPCIANFFMIVKERGWRTGLAIAAFIFPFAVAVGAAVNAVLRAVPLPLR